MADPFVAEIRIFPFNFAPQGWAWCDGQLLPLSQMRQRIQASLTRSAKLAFLITAGVSLLGCVLSLSLGVASAIRR